MSNLKKAVSLVVACLLSVTMLASCKTTGNTQKNQKVIGVSMDNVTDPYWKADVAAMQTEATKLGVKLVVQVANGDSSKQTQQIQSFITQKVSAIICAPHDAQAILQAVTQCNQAKIPFLSNDRIVPSTATANISYSVGTDNFSLAQSGAQWFVDYAKKNNVKLNVLELLGDLGDPNTAARSQGFEGVAAANPDVMQVIAKVPTKWDLQVCLAGTVNALEANKNINVIYMQSDMLFPSVVSALKQVNRYVKDGENGHVMIAALGGYSATLDAINQGYADLMMSCPIITEGTLSVQNAVALANGQKLASAVDTNPGLLVDQSNFSVNAYKTFGYLGKQK